MRMLGPKGRKKKRRGPEPPPPFEFPDLRLDQEAGAVFGSLILDEPFQVHRAGVAGIDIARVVGADAFERTEVFLLLDEGRDLAVLGAADPDALLEARIELVARL